MSEKRFVPQPGQVDFTNIRFAPVINCVVMFQGKILLVKRSETLNFYPGYWNGISGFLDDQKDFDEKVREEIHEELGLESSHIQTIQHGQIFHQDEPKYNKTWIVHPVLVSIDTDRINTDWESQSLSWVAPSQARKMKLLPGFEKVLDSFQELSS